MILTLDFETYYTTDYSLSKLSTEEYIRDPRFEVIGCGIAINNGPAVWYSGNAVGPALRALPWGEASLLAFNTVFDGAILGWVYGIYPALYLDAMGMAKALGKTYKGASLSKVAEMLGIGVKGDFVTYARGKRLADFTPQELQQYGQYCCNDVDLTRKIFKVLNPSFPQSEVRIQDLNLRLFIDPVLHFDVPKLHTYHTEVVAEKWRRLVKVAGLLGLDWGNVELPDDNSLLQTYEQLDEGKLLGSMKTELASNPRFASLLEAQGIDPPMKISPTTGKPTYAFAKTDPEFMELLESEDPSVQALVSARLGIKSTIEETRAQRFIEAAARGPFAVMYNYWGATPGRFTGSDKMNAANLKRGGTLRDAILPPPGHKIVAADLRQIEARVINYVAMQDDIIQAFKQHDEDPTQHPDVYCILAEKIYRKPVTGGIERMVGKVGELQLGFGGGEQAFKRTLFKETNGTVTMTQHERQGVVDIYRGSHENVVKLWNEGNQALKSMRRGVGFDIGRPGILRGDPDGIGLPNGMKLYYPELQQAANVETGETWYEYAKKGKRVKIYGSVVAQNITEALSRIILTDAWLRIADRLRVVLHTYDELVVVVPHADVQWAMALLEEELTRPVPWAPGLPIAVEVKSGRTYGEARK